MTQIQKNFEVTKKSQSIEKKIPMAIFIEHVEEICKKHGTQSVMQSLDEAYNKYKLIQSQLIRSNQNMIMKIPQIEKALDIIKTLKKEKKISVDFMLSDSVWAKAKSNDKLEKIALWLGANTMIQLTFQQAEKMLKENLLNAKGNLKQIKEDLNYVKDQVTTSEVNIARVYNYSLAQKKNEKQKEK